MSPGLTLSAPPRFRSSMVMPWLAPTNERSTTMASPIPWSSEISAVVIPSLKTCSGESMCAPVWSPWLTLETCQKPGPRRCGVISTRMLVEGGLSVFEFTATERSMSFVIANSTILAGRKIPVVDRLLQELFWVVLPKLADRLMGVDHGFLKLASNLLDFSDVDILRRVAVGVHLNGATWGVLDLDFPQGGHEVGATLDVSAYGFHCLAYCPRSGIAVLGVER